MILPIKHRKNIIGKSAQSVIIISILLCFAVVFSRAQSVSLFDIDTTNFPAMKAKFYCFNAKGQFFYPESSQIQLRENGRPVTITGISCPPVKPPMLISSILTVDISVSMSAGEPGKTNLDLVKAAAHAWIQGLPPGQSECALTSFNDKCYLNQDYTPDRSLIRNALQFLTPAGATDYTKAILDPIAGAFQISKAGRYKRVIVFLSDGLPNSAPPAEEIIAEAKKLNCTIFAVALGLSCPPLLKQITEQTGGRWYDNVTTVPQAEQAYRNILQTALGNEPCIVEWDGQVSCSASRTLEMKMPALHFTSSESFVPANAAVSSLEISPHAVQFGIVQPGETKEVRIRLTAGNTTYIIQSIVRKHGNGNFRLADSTSFPLVIPAGASKTVTLIYSPTDVSRVYSGFDIIAEPCNAYFSASAGAPGKKIKRDDISLNVDFPNGGEYLIAGGDTTLRWSGVAPSDTVTLSYSPDNGQTWKVITRQATGLSYRWRIPNMSGFHFLLRVSQSSGDIPQPLRTFAGHAWWVNSAAFSPDGKTLTTASVDNTAKIWNVETGALLRTLTGHTNWVRKAIFSPDGRRILTVSDDNTAKIWDVGSGKPLQTFTDSKWGINSAAFSPDGRRIITTSADGTAKILDASNGEVEGVLRRHTHEVNDAGFNPDGTNIVTGGWDNMFIVWDEKTRTPLLTRTSHTKPIQAVSFSGDGNYILSAGDDNVIKLWDAARYTLLRSFGFHRQTVNSARFSPDASAVVSTGRGDSAAKVWDVQSGALLMSLAHKAPVASADFSPDGKYIITASHDKTAKLWDAEEQPLQDDQSDAEWVIISPTLTASSIDFGKVAVGGGRDSIIADFISNTGAYPVRVDSLWIENDPKEVFSFVAGMPPFTIEKHDKQAVELHCNPPAAGVYSATIAALSQTGDVIRLTVSCTGVVPAAQIVNSIISFPETDVGSQRDTIDAAIIRNTGREPIEITSAEITGQDETPFSLLSEPTGVTLAPGAVARFNLRFTPKSGGRVQGRLLVQFNGFGSPSAITLYGEGRRRDPMVTVRIVKRSSGKPIADAEISVRDVRNNIIRKEVSNEDGVFSLTAAAGTELEISASTGQLLPDSRKLIVYADTTVELSLAESVALRINFNDNEAEVPYPFVLDNVGAESNQTWQEAIQLLADYLIQYKNNIQKFIVVGHSDDRGSPEYNLRLGLLRARFVADELIKRGVPEDLLRPSTKGKSELLPQNIGEDVESYRKRCRRIETRMIFK